MSESPVTRELFTPNSYRRMLVSLQQVGYRFVTVDDPSLALETAPRQGLVYLRHDIDADPHAALRMARVEAALGVTSTYFFMLRSPVYNLFAPHIRAAATSIIDLGHKVGLHFDVGTSTGEAPGAGEILEGVYQESSVLERELGCEVRVVSWHQPSATVLKQVDDIGRLENVYGTAMRSVFMYLSDSNMSWQLRYVGLQQDQSIEAAFPNSIQILIHPMWWMTNGTEPREKWDRILIENSEHEREFLSRTERSLSAKGIIGTGPPI